jgi:methylglyoxal synthase
MAATKKLGKNKRIVLIAHDNKKKDLAEWVADNKHLLIGHELYATGTTGKMIEDIANAPVNKLMSGPLGGDQQVGSMLAQGLLDLMIFFWDPMESQAHDSDVKALLRLGAVWNIPLACDRASADFIITSPFMTREYEAVMPDYSAYLNRKIN